MNLPIYLVGNLATHRRKRILQELVGANALPEQDHKPNAGLCVLFGNDYQGALEPTKKSWLTWFRQPGRSLLLVPPFEASAVGTPTDWEIQFREYAASAATDGLAKLLESEVQFEIKGNQIQLDIEQGHRWQDFSLNTGFFKPHSHSGLLAVTVLPIWSLTVLGHQELLRAWLTALHGNAGSPKASRSQESPEFQPKEHHFTLMVHLWSMPMASSTATLTALAESEILQLSPDAARQGLQELETAGLSQGGQLTEAGIAMLQHSPYWGHAEALRGVMQ